MKASYFIYNKKSFIFVSSVYLIFRIFYFINEIVLLYKCLPIFPVTRQKLLQSSIFQERRSKCVVMEQTPVVPLRQSDTGLYLSQVQLQFSSVHLASGQHHINGRADEIMPRCSHLSKTPPQSYANVYYNNQPTSSIFTGICYLICSSFCLQVTLQQPIN